MDSFSRVIVPCLAGSNSSFSRNAKVAVRNIRRDVNDALKKEEKAKTITEDDAKDGLDEIQKLTDAKVKHIENCLL